jgi:hypothetical protein
MKIEIFDNIRENRKIFENIEEDDNDDIFDNIGILKEHDENEGVVYLDQKEMKYTSFGSKETIKSPEKLKRNELHDFRLKSTISKLSLGGTKNPVREIFDKIVNEANSDLYWTAFENDADKPWRSGSKYCLKHDEKKAKAKQVSNQQIQGKNLEGKKVQDSKKTKRGRRKVMTRSEHRSVCANSKSRDRSKRKPPVPKFRRKSKKKFSKQNSKESITSQIRSKSTPIQSKALDMEQTVKKRHKVSFKPALPKLDLKTLSKIVKAEKKRRDEEEEKKMLIIQMFQKGAKLPANFRERLKLKPKVPKFDLKEIAKDMKIARERAEQSRKRREAEERERRIQDRKNRLEKMRLDREKRRKEKEERDKMLAEEKRKRDEAMRIKKEKEKKEKARLEKLRKEKEKREMEEKQRRVAEELERKRKALELKQKKEEERREKLRLEKMRREQEKREKERRLREKMEREQREKEEREERERLRREEKERLRKANLKINIGEPALDCGGLVEIECPAFGEERHFPVMPEGRVRFAEKPIPLDRELYWGVNGPLDEACGTVRDFSIEPMDGPAHAEEYDQIVGDLIRFRIQQEVKAKNMFVRVRKKIGEYGSGSGSGFGSGK